MAEDYARSRQYAYTSNSNLVLQADSETRRRADEPTGEVESLAGKISYRMGDRAQRATPYEDGKKAKADHTRAKSKSGRRDGADADEPRKKPRRAGDAGVMASGGGLVLAAARSDILRASSALEASSYQPTNPQSQEAYELLLGVVAQQLGDQPGEILAGAAEEVLAILKSDAYRDDDKLREVHKLLKQLPTETFSRLVAAGKRVTDFYVPGEGGSRGGHGDHGEEAKREGADGDDAMDGQGDDMDKEMGVAVVFDDEEEEEESDLDEVRDEEDEEDEDEDEVEGGQGRQHARASSRREAMRMKGDFDEQADEEASKFRLDVHAIDAFWLQRELSKRFQDAERSAALAEEVLGILKEAGSDLSACENRLVLLLDYDKFDFIKLLLTNRAKVLYCTRLKQAQDDAERAQTEAEMLADESLDEGEAQDILDRLQSTASADSWMQDRIGAMETTSRAEANKLRKLQSQRAAAGTRGDAQGSESESEGDVDMDSGASSSAAAAAASAATASGGEAGKKAQRYIDVEALAFQDGGHLMSNKECRLPEGTWRAQKKGYEEVHVPAVRSLSSAAEEEARIKVSALPAWAQPAFKNMTSLNRVQSKMYPAAFTTSDNLLLCAPTGAGKTNVAMLAILHEVLKARDAETGEIDRNAFKIVYVAPMKALVQEVVLNLSARLTSAYGLHVRELSGDQNLSREQLFDTQIIVTTPEKWDIVTRKAGDDRAYTQLVRLVILDEVHLLHDSRGPVLEALVARTIRNVEATQQLVRLVGLSATLPNYEDVAAFLRVDPAKGLFYFDGSYRPVPLQQQYIGIMEKKAVKRFALMNAICYEKVLEQAERDNQVLIFVHSRKETAATARALRDLFVEHDSLSKLLREHSASSEVLREEADKVERNDDLKDLLAFGFGIHHAGMKRADRTLVENAFAAGHLKVLVSTATLAWGVNLPAHTVIIKGTQVYNAERGDWCELSPLDILQMLGRAGRVQYDTQGEGIILTQHAQLTYYLSLMNQQLPVESQLLSRLADHLNAEIVAGSVQTLAQAATWLGYTYLFIRMLRNPALYGVSPAYQREDPTLLQFRTDLAHSAATLLAKHNLIKYERRAGLFQVTALGRVASHYYIAHDSIRTYNAFLKPQMSDIEILRLFALSSEFKYVSVRAEEKLELVKLLERVPVPVKESLVSSAGGGGHGSGAAKVNVLLQAYISRLQLDGFALLADMVHIHQSAARIFRALFEICLTRGWAALSERMLNLCKMVDKRMWLSHSPLRQLSPALPDAVVKRLERKDLAWDKYADLEPSDLGQLVHNAAMGKTLYRAIHQFPKLELSAHVQPITRAMLKVELVVTPDFEFNREVHGNAEGFWLLVVDVDGTQLLHHEWLLLKRRFAAQELLVSFTVPLFEPLAPLYYIKVVSDKWLHCESTLPVSLHKLLLPQKNAPPTELLDLQPLSVAQALRKLANGKAQVADAMLAALGGRVAAATRKQRGQHPQEPSAAPPSAWTFTRLNPIQTQVAPRILEADSNLLIASPPGSGKTVLAELAVMKALVQLGQPAEDEEDDKEEEDDDDHLIVYLTPKEASCRERLDDWRVKFGERSYWRQQVCALTGDATADLRLLARASVLIATPTQWDALSRRWKQRRRVQRVSLLLLDEAHLLGGGEYGPTMEVVMSRMRFIGAEMAKKRTSGSSDVGAASNSTERRRRRRYPSLRIVALGNSMANARDVGEWLGASAADGGVFNFHPNVRPQPLEIRVQGFDMNDFSSRMLAMAKPMYNAVALHVAPPPHKQQQHKPQKQQHKPRALVFVPSDKQAQLSAIDLMTFALAENDADKFVASRDPALGELPAGERGDRVLAQTLRCGVGYVTDAMPSRTRAHVLRAFAGGQLSVLVAPHALAWELRSCDVRASLVVLLGTQLYDGKEHRYVDYQLADVWQMTKFARSSDADAAATTVKCVVLCHASRKKFLATSLYEPLPVESQLEHFLSDHLNAEVVTKTVESKQDAVDYLTWTFMYRRLVKNPNYYNLLGATTAHLSDHLSELVETTVSALEESRCLQVVEEDEEGDEEGGGGGGGERLAPLNLGMIAAYYYVQYTTIELFACSLTAQSKLKALLAILASATELSELPCRAGEEERLEALAKHAKYPVATAGGDYSPPHVKANVLLQAHFSRQHARLSRALRKDLDVVLTHAVRLLHAMVDVLSSSGWLKPALAAMDLAQMVVQAQWSSDSPLLQIPFVDRETLARLERLGLADEVETPVDILSMDEGARRQLLPPETFDKARMSAVAAFCNAFPDVNVRVSVAQGGRNLPSGAPVGVSVVLEREGADEEEDEDEQEEDQDALGLVQAPLFPVPKAANWWVVLGDASKNALLAIKRVPFAGKRANVQLQVAAPEQPGDYALQLYVVCDGYAGCDLENEVALHVVDAGDRTDAGDEEDEEDEDEDE